MSMKPQRSGNAARVEAERVSKQWHAVTIVAKSSSCDAARAARNTRYLSAEAPRLPLADCSKPDACPCAYKHYADRRAEARRADDDGGPSRSTSVTPERRMRPDRRKSD
jgi:hypothetical protein